MVHLAKNKVFVIFVPDEKHDSIISPFDAWNKGRLTRELLRFA
jgi:hypothetical protein